MVAVLLPPVRGQAADPMSAAAPIEDLPVGINLSGGTSSEWMFEAVVQGVIPRPLHVAAFCANTGDEHVWTYERLERVRERAAAAGIPFFDCADRETLSGHILDATSGNRTRADTPPFWTENPGGGRGQLRQECTKRFKTAAIRRAQSAWLKSIGKAKRISTWIGFGNDEQHRANKALARQDVKWATMDFPAIRTGTPRGQQRADLVKWTGGAPPFSACVMCPFNNLDRLRQQSECDARKSDQIDEAIRDGLEGVGVHETCFQHDSLVPLSRLRKYGVPQGSLPGLESPGCDAGQCFL